jgi:hypothetical protein
MVGAVQVVVTEGVEVAVMVPVVAAEGQVAAVMVMVAVRRGLQGCTVNLVTGIV